MQKLYFLRKFLFSDARKYSIEEIIKLKLAEKFSNANSIEVLNKSSSHSRGKETHFDLKIISDEFQNKTLIQKHRMVYELFDFEFKNTELHSLNLLCQTNKEHIENPKKIKHVPCKNKEK